MAFIFTMRSTPVGSMHQRDPPSAGSLPAISEDGASFTEPPPVPPRASNRPAHKHFGLGAPPKITYERSPPTYGHFSFVEVNGPAGEKLAAARKGVANNKHIAKRGGWKRLLIAGLILALIIVGLVVGLVVGLRNRNKSSSL